MKQFKKFIFGTLDIHWYYWIAVAVLGIACFLLIESYLIKPESFHHVPLGVILAALIALALLFSITTIISLGLDILATLSKRWNPDDKQDVFLGVIVAVVVCLVLMIRMFEPHFDFFVHHIRLFLCRIFRDCFFLCREAAAVETLGIYALL